MTQEVNLNSLKELEREMVLQVLYRDQMVQKVEEERIRKLKLHLHDLRWRPAKNTNQEYKEKFCARCQKSLGLLINRGGVCQGCSHRVCSECRVFLRKTYMWKCTVCFADGDVKIKTGEWFFEERAKKFPAESKHETAGAKLLKSYQKLSKISVVPPTPPPVSESHYGSNTGELGQLKGFNKSMENLFLSLTTHIKKISKSQNDMTSDKHLLTTNYREGMDRKERRSQSDTAINLTTRTVSVTDHLKLVNQEDDENFINPILEQENILPTSSHSIMFSGGIKRGSLVSISSTCTEVGSFDNADVTGEILFSLQYDFKASTLEICIKGCRNLAFGEEKKKKCNPYIKTYLLPDRGSQAKRKTSVKKNTVDPLFHETLKYRVEYSQLQTRLLQVSAWHLGTLTRKVFLGEVLIPLASWNFEDSTVQSFHWHQLKAKNYRTAESQNWRRPQKPSGLACT
ncbi:synaptotagmin-like protein 3 [Phascolarctos cinereus]|uniref:Synaptotagmin-like protein 3 isoform X1 n=1 Tax=Phascolarctos cinereus TaxID=38626 RepID=A0A6P5KA89_PHACI|nr:synaptotagmin-like protein 3 isoform X1 [Phascolarctos cinereus]